MVQIVGSDDLVLDTLVVELDCMFSIIAPKNEQILNSELLCLTPSNFEALIFSSNLFFELACIKQIVNFLIVNLQEGAGDCD